MSLSNSWRTQTGPAEEHPWVLLAGGDVDTLEEMRSACTRRGWETYACDGPRAGHSCPLTEGGVCSVVEGAQLVVTDLDPADQRVAAFLATLTDRYPDLPVMESADLRS